MLIIKTKINLKKDNTFFYPISVMMKLHEITMMELPRYVSFEKLIHTNRIKVGKKVVIFNNYFTEVCKWRC